MILSEIRLLSIGKSSPFVCYLKHRLTWVASRQWNLMIRMKDDADEIICSTVNIQMRTRLMFKDLFIRWMVAEYGATDGWFSWLISMMIIKKLLKVSFTKLFTIPRSWWWQGLMVIGPIHTKRLERRIEWFDNIVQEKILQEPLFVPDYFVDDLDESHPKSIFHLMNMDVWFGWFWRPLKKSQKSIDETGQLWNWCLWNQDNTHIVIWLSSNDSNDILIELQSDDVDTHQRVLIRQRLGDSTLKERSAVKSIVKRTLIWQMTK